MKERDRFHAAAEIFLEAGAIGPERVDAFLVERCGGDGELIALVRDMLAKDSDSRVFRTLVEHLEPVRQGLRMQVVDGHRSKNAPLSAPAFEESAGEWIGKYQLVQRLGEGGFGRVWIAEQAEPVRRRVALKVIKAGMDSREVLARFEMERQALAIMDHPSVAKVFDAGVTDRGRPYFVMELVDGASITAVCDRERMSTRGRIEMLATVCEAVNHAHQKGVIHRDLKPSNILVTMVDGKPLPKVIDFGIAKATQSMTDQTLRTEAGRMMGTPEYMSPEQASGDVDVDTRTDVYSLGVVAYELITGSLPFDSRDLRHAGPDGIVRMIREVDPPKPSTRISARAGATDAAADTRSLQRELRGEVDWIVMKCLEKDRSRRYESASSLASDLRRYLAGEAIHAAPRSTWYQVRTIIRRNKGLVAAATLVGAALVAGLTGTLWQANQARRSAETAVRKERLARTVNTFFSSEILGKADPDRVGSDKPVTLKEAVDQASKKLEGMYEDEPLILAEIHTVLGEAYRGMAQFAEALRHLEAARTLRLSAFGPESPEALRDAHQVATVMRMAGTLQEAEKLFTSTLEARRRTLGAAHPETCASLTGLAELYVTQNENEKAVPLLEEALAGQRASLGDRDMDTLQTMESLVVAYVNIKRVRQAVDLGEVALEGFRATAGPDHPQTTAMMGVLAGVCAKQGNYDRALTLEREADDAERRVLGEDHPNRISTYCSIGQTLLAKGDVDGAIRVYEDAVAICRKSTRVDAGTKANTMSKLAAALVTAKRFDEAERSLLEAHPILLSLYGPKHYRTIRAANALVSLYEATGQPEKAAQWRATAEGRELPQTTK